MIRRKIITIGMGLIICLGYLSINGPNLVEAAPAANDMEEIDEAINQFVKDKAINITTIMRFLLGW